MTAPRVSVVIPAYNCGPMAAEAVASALAQTAPPAEVIVVDDGSTDDTADHLAGFGPPVRVIRQPNGGVSAARNRGLAEATGDWIGFLDADDVWHPRKLELQLAALAARPDLGLLAAWAYDWPAAIHPPVAGPGRVAVLPLADLVVHNTLTTSAVLARADVLRAVGPFDTSLQGPEDFDLWLRIAQRAAVARLDLALAGYRAAVPGSLSKNAARMEVGLRRILDKLEAAGVFRDRPGLRRQAWAGFRQTCAMTYRDAGRPAIAADRLARSLAGWPRRLTPTDRRLRALVNTCWRLAAGYPSGLPGLPAGG